MKPLISICIPAYKREDYLKRLLNSIAIQTYRNFEVVITDDSKDDSVNTLIEGYRSLFPIIYQKNNQQLGTPENWNESIRKAGGEWIKLMHDDDWFAGPESLSQLPHPYSLKRILYSAHMRMYSKAVIPLKS